MTTVTTYKLTIFKADGSVYWVTYFNDSNSLNEWLTAEKTRPYWDPAYTTTTEEQVSNAPN